MSFILDTNLIIRFLTKGDTGKSAKVRKLLSGNDTLILTDVIVNEIIWVLLSFYKLPKEEIISNITSLIELPNVYSNKSLIGAALYVWEKNNVEYVDAYILALAKTEDRKIYSFDRQLVNISQGIAVEP